MIFVRIGAMIDVITSRGFGCHTSVIRHYHNSVLQTCLNGFLIELKKPVRCFVNNGIGL